MLQFDVLEGGICGIANANVVGEFAEIIKLTSNVNHLTWTLILQKNKISSKRYETIKRAV